MPRKSAKSPIPPSVRSRRSAGASEFLSLDLYSNGKVGEVINVFKADENHNGIKVESVTVKKSPATPSSAAAPKKRVRVKSEAVSPPGTTPAKRSKRDSSDSSSVVTPSSSVVVVTPKRGRGRPKGSGKAATAVPKTPKKERDSSVETQSSSVVVVATAKRGRPKGSGKAGATKKAGAGKSAAGKSVSMPPLAVSARKSVARTPKKQQPPTFKQELPTDDEEMEEVVVEEAPAPDQNEIIMENVGQDGGEREVKPDPRTIRSMRVPGTASAAGVKKRLHSAIDESTRMNNNQLSFPRRKALVTRLTEVVNCASTMTASDFDNVMDNLLMVENYIKSGGAPPSASDSAALQDKIASLEAEKAAMLEDMGKMDKMLADRQKEIETAMKTVDETREEKANMQEELQALKDRMDAEASARHSAVSTSSSRTTRSEGPGISARSAYHNNNNNMAAIRASGPPMFDPQCMQGMPSGSAIGHTTMAGRANEVISGIGHVTGMEDAYASVAVTAATVPDMDEWGNVIQRTIRTTVERIAVPDGMNVEQLQAMGYEIAGYTGGSDDEEDDEEEEVENQRNGRGATIEEVNGGYNDFGSENGEGDGPLIEEVE